ncbi:hypothetical protein HDU93_002733 [Gonapodya sp. JEL0774]|nr:hypothetical protein HDU93_002733 [Gonapodya sp. JEL0774]
MSCVRNCDSLLLDPSPHHNSSEPAPAPAPVYYEQPVWQTMIMFFGECLCLVAVYTGHAVHAIIEARRAPVPPATPNGHPHPAQHAGWLWHVKDPLALPDTVLDDDPLDTQLVPVDDVQTLSGWKRLLLWVPALCDICATTLMNVGLIFVAASVYQMLRGGVVFFTALFSSSILGRRFERFQWAALAFVVAGVAIVGASPLIEGSAKVGGEVGGVAVGGGTGGGAWTVAGVDASAVGVGMVLLAQMFTATQFILEEKIMSGYHLHPLMAVGLEGTFGLFTSLTALLLLDATVTPTHPGTYVDLREGFTDTFLRNPTVAWAALGTILIWFISLQLGWERFRGTQVLGFCVLLYGTMTFNGVIRPLPFLAPRSIQLPSGPPSRDEQYVAVRSEGDL